MKRVTIFHYHRKSWNLKNIYYLFELVRRDVFHKNDRKESQLYLKELTLWYIRLNIYVWKTKFSSHKQYLFDLLFSRNAKKTHIDQSILHSFLLCLKINVSQTFRSSSCKNVFCKCACQWYNLLRWMLFIQKQPFRECSHKKVFWRYAANLQENTHAEVWFE